jgi:hypothetical protein
MSLDRRSLYGESCSEKREHLLTHSLKLIFATLLAKSALSKFVSSAEMEEHDAAGAQQDEIGLVSFFSAVPQHEDLPEPWFLSL